MYRLSRILAEEELVFRRGSSQRYHYYSTGTLEGLPACLPVAGSGRALLLKRGNSLLAAAAGVLSEVGARVASSVGFLSRRGEDGPRGSRKKKDTASIETRESMWHDRIETEKAIFFKNKIKRNARSRNIPDSVPVDYSREQGKSDVIG